MTESFLELSTDEKRHAAAKFLLHRTVPATGLHPVSYGQETLWALSRASPESGIYNMSFSGHILAALDAGAIKTAFRRVLERRSVLRSSFGHHLGWVVRRELEDFDLPLAERDLDGSDDATVQELIGKEASRPFDLERGLPLRALLIKKGPKDYRLLVSAHQIILDFWSLSILIQDLRQAYRSLMLGSAAETAADQPGFDRFVLWQVERVVSTPGRRALEFWGQQLGGALEPTRLPADHPWPAKRGFRESEHRFEIGGADARKLQARAALHGSTLFTLLLAAYNVLLYSYSGQTEITVVSPTAGRSSAEFERMVGYCVNHVILRSHLDAGETFETLLGRVRETVMAAMTHREFPFPLIAKRTRVGPLPEGAVPFPVKFNMPKAYMLGRQGVAELGRGEAGLLVPMQGFNFDLDYVDQRVVATCDLHLTLMETRNGLWASLQYNSEIFEVTTIRNLAARFLCLVQAIAQGRNDPLRELAAAARAGAGD